MSFLLLSISYFEEGSLTEPGAPASLARLSGQQTPQDKPGSSPTSSGVVDVDVCPGLVMWVLGIRTQVLMLVLPTFYLLNYVFYNSEQ